MSDDFLQIDDVSEAGLPPALRGHGDGDRVAFVEGGVLSVVGGRATFAPLSAILATTEHAGRAYLLVARRSPSPPWIEVWPEHLAGATVSRFLTRLAERQRDRGYRDPVRERRHGLDAAALFAAVVAERRDIPGALDVPARGLSHAAYPGLSFAQFGVFFLACLVGYVPMFLASALNVGPLLYFSLLTLAVITFVLGALAMPMIGRVWRRRVDARRRRPRLLSLTPDGCVLGLESGPKAFGWPEIERFEAEPDALRVLGSRGSLARIEARLLGAPVPLIVAVAEAYGAAAR